MWFLSKSLSSSFFLSLNCMGKLRSRPASLTKMHQHLIGFDCLCFLAVTFFLFKLVDINVDGSLGSDPSEVLSLGCPLCGKRQ